MVTKHMPLTILMDALTATLMLVLIVATWQRSFSRKSKVLMTGLWLLLATVLCDCVSHVLDGIAGPLPRLFAYLGHELTFLLGILTFIAIVGYVRIDVSDRELGGEQGKKAILAYISLNITNALLVLTNPLTHIYFDITPDNVFVRGPYLWIYGLFMALHGAAIIPILVRYRHKFKRITRVRFSICCFLMVAGALVDVVHPTFVTIYPATAFVLVMMVAGVQVHIEEDLARMRAEAAESRLRLLSGQIHPHFIFNSLAAIEGLIAEDPEKAGLAIQDFSDYLRSRLDVMASTKLVPFTDELDHILHYVALEQADPIVPLEMCYDLQVDDFQLPPLTVQPLVENAIRHGIRTRQGGGTVVLSTRRENDCVVVSVSDDGHGFSSVTARQDERRRIGIANVRERIERQCGGTLDVQSGRKGTIATLTIPERAEG